MSDRPRGLRRAATAAFLFMALGTGAAHADRVELVSRFPEGVVSDTGGNVSSLPGVTSLGMHRQVVSADGRWIVFSSFAPNLAAGQVDLNLQEDVFLRDRVLGTTVLVSRVGGAPDTAASRASSTPSISADGRYVAFVSSATNLVPGQVDTNNTDDVFLWDRDTGAVTLVSRSAASASEAGNGFSSQPMISTDGGAVGFVSRANNLVAGQTPASTNDDVFLWDRASGALTLVSHADSSATTDGNGTSSMPVLSADGAWVAYLSGSTNLVAGATDTNTRVDAFLWSRAANTSQIVSRASTSATTTGGGTASNVRITADGASVLFLSDGNNHVANDVNFSADAFLFNRSTSGLTIVSRSSTSATTTGNLSVIEAALSADGNWVGFASAATNHVSGQQDTNNVDDIFLWSRSTGVVSLVTRRPGLPTTASASTAFQPYHIQLSADGAWMSYLTRATQLVAGQVDVNGVSDLFVFERATGTNLLVSGFGGSASTTSQGLSKVPAISADGQWIAYMTTGTDVVPGVVDANGQDDVLLFDRVTRANSVVSRRAPSAPSATAGGSVGITGLGGNTFQVLSADGRYLAFSSPADRLIPSQVDRNTAGDVFLLDRETGTITLVSRAQGTARTTGNAESRLPVISADGRWVTFISRASNLVAGQSDNTATTDDVFLWSRETGAMTLVSHTTAGAATAAAAPAVITAPLAISSDGSWIVYPCNSNNLVAGQVDATNSTDLFLFERATGTNTLVSRTRNGATSAAGNASEPWLSADGRFIAFLSNSALMVAGQTDPTTNNDLFLWDRVGGSMTLVSHTTAAATTAAGALAPALSADGNWLAFSSTSTAVVPGVTDTNGVADLFLWERATGETRLVSHTAADAAITGNKAAQGAVLSADGSRLAYLSSATNLVAGNETRILSNAFVFERATGQNLLASHTPAGPSMFGDGFASRRVSISADGSRVSFQSSSTNLIPGQIDIPLTSDLFTFDPDTGRVRLASFLPGSPATATALSNDAAEGGFLSADGGVAAFYTANSKLVPDDNNGTFDLFLWIAEDTDADLSITKTDGVTSAVPGQGVTYTITATNAGPSPTTATVTDSFPAALQGASWTCVTGGGATCSGSGVGNLVDTVALPVNGTVTYTVNATVAADATGTLDNTATLTLPAGVSDPVPGNNSATDSDTLKPRANLAATLSDSPDPVGRGATLTYSIGVSNAGPSHAGSVSVVQTLPAEVTFGSATGDGWSCGEAAGTVTCTRPSLATGSAPALTVLVTAPVARGIATLSTSVTVSSAAEDVDGNDNTATADTAVPQPGITVTPTSGLVTTEAGGTDTFTVVLDTAPLADVTIALTSGDGGEGTAAPASLTFTTGNWSTPQTVTVTGQDDDLTDGDAAYTIETGAAESTDAGYAGIDPGDVAAANQDDSSEGTYFTLAPCRLLDTRTPQDGPALANGEIGMLAVHGGCGVPSTARAVAVSVTAVGGDDVGHLLIYPGDLAEAPVLTFLPVCVGRNTALFTVMPLAADGSGTLALEPRLAPTEMNPIPTVHVVVDVMGYFE